MKCSAQKAHFRFIQSFELSAKSPPCSDQGRGQRLDEKLADIWEDQSRDRKGQLEKVCAIKIAPERASFTNSSSDISEKLDIKYFYEYFYFVWSKSS